MRQEERVKQLKLFSCTCGQISFEIDLKKCELILKSWLPPLLRPQREGPFKLKPFVFLNRALRRHFSTGIPSSQEHEGTIQILHEPPGPLYESTTVALHFVILMTLYTNTPLIRNNVCIVWGRQTDVGGKNILCTTDICLFFFFLINSLVSIKELKQMMGGSHIWKTTGAFFFSWAILASVHWL